MKIAGVLTGRQFLPVPLRHKFALEGERSKQGLYAFGAQMNEDARWHRVPAARETHAMFGRNAIFVMALIAFSPPCYSGALDGTKVRIFLCDTEDAALAFALARTENKVSDDFASDIVNKAEKRRACDRYIGYVSKEVGKRKVVQGYLFRLVRYRLQFSDRRGALDAWSAERMFDATPQNEYRDL